MFPTRILKLTLISATGLKDVSCNMFPKKKMKVYAIVSLYGLFCSPGHRVTPDRSGGSNPSFIPTLHFNVPANASGGLYLRLRARRHVLGDHDIGETTIPLSYLLSEAPAGRNVPAKFYRATVWEMGSKKPRGSLYFSCKLGEVRSVYLPAHPPACRNVLPYQRAEYDTDEDIDDY